MHASEKRCKDYFWNDDVFIYDQQNSVAIIVAWFMSYEIVTGSSWLVVSYVNLADVESTLTYGLQHDKQLAIGLAECK